MELIWGVVIIGLGLLAWLGQTISWLAPRAAARLSLAEAQASVDDGYWADIRGEAAWDAVSLWTLPLAGALLVAGTESWAWLGLVAGGIFVYFGGRGIFTRRELSRRGHRIGEPANVRLGLAMLAVWGAAGLITVVAAMAALA